MKLLSGTSHPHLAKEVSENLGIPLMKASVRRFPDQEIFVEIHESFRGEDVFVLQPTSFPANDHLMELLVMLDTLKRGSARRVTACIPYFGYARQDRKSGPRTPISAKLVADLLTVAGAGRILALDLHTGQIQGFFNIPVDNLCMVPCFAQEIHKKFPDEAPLIVSPDVGGLVRARALAKRLSADLAIIDKRRGASGESEVMQVMGNVEGRTTLIIDDIVDSGGTLCQAAEALMNNGAASVYGYATHGVLSGEAVARIEKSALQALTLTNSIPLARPSSKISVFSISSFLAEAISHIHQEKSLSSLFD